MSDVSGRETVLGLIAWAPASLGNCPPEECAQYDWVLEVRQLVHISLVVRKSQM